MLLNDLVAWARSSRDVLAVALCGSYARGSARTDSDVDLIIVSACPQGMLSETQWIDRFGEVMSVAREDYGLVQSLRVHYSTGLEVEFGITCETWLALPIDQGTARVITDGIRALYDPAGKLEAAIADARGPLA